MMYCLSEELLHYGKEFNFPSQNASFGDKQYNANINMGYCTYFASFIPCLL